MASLPESGALRAAMRWLMYLRTEDVPRLRVLFTHNRRYSDLTPVQYSEGLVWLRRVGLVTGDDRLASVPSRAECVSDLLAAVLEIARPSWLAARGWPLGGPEWSGEAERVADALGMSVAEVTTVALSVRCKVDTAMRELVGAEGEKALLELLQQSLDAEIRHVAAESDSYGYDIGVSGPGRGPVHIEVKTTTDPTRLVVYLSRHEYETMRWDEGWVMVAVLLGPHGEVAGLAEVSRDWLMRARPSDGHAAARWETARLAVPGHALFGGIRNVRIWSRGPAAVGTLSVGTGRDRPLWGRPSVNVRTPHRT